MAWAPDYCSSGELAAFTRISGSEDDTQLALAIAAASRAVDRAASRGQSPGRQFGVVASVEARYYTARYDALLSRWVVDIDDLMTATGLLVAYDTDGDATYADAITGYALLPRNAVVKGAPWSELAVLADSAVQPTAVEGAVKVTALWGWTAVPAAVKQATLLQASRILSRRNSPYGVAGSPDAGSELRLLARVDPDVEVALAPYRRRRRVVFG